MEAEAIDSEDTSWFWKLTKNQDVFNLKYLSFYLAKIKK